MATAVEEKVPEDQSLVDLAEAKLRMLLSVQTKPEGTMELIGALRELRWMKDSPVPTPVDPPVVKGISADLDTRFTYHKPEGDQSMRYTNIRGQAKDLAVLMVRECPESRELSLAMTKLEEAVMWANAAIARRSNSANNPSLAPQPAATRA